jgi:hypothetical protein
MASPSTLFINDNSNPQQGTEIAVLMKSALEGSTAGGGSIKHHGKLVVPATNKSADEQLNPPHSAEEIRKLFVGGLPTDSKCRHKDWDWRGTPSLIG